MADLLTPEERRRLGLEHATFKEAQRIAIPEGAPLGKAGLFGAAAALASLGVTRGLASAALVGMGSLAADSHPREVGIANPWNLRFFWDDRKRLLFYGDVPLKVEAVDPSLVFSTSEDGCTVTLESDGRYVVRVQPQSGLVVHKTSSEIWYQPFSTPIPTPEPFATIEVPLEDLLREVRSDWLRQEVEKYLEESWSRVVGMGLLLRYWDDGLTARETRALVRDLMDGKNPDIVQRIETWIKGLSDAQVRTIQDWAQAACFSLRLQMESLEKSFCLEDDWIEELVAACRERDDLEAVRWLLEDSSALDESLRDLDEEASAFLITIPVALRPDEPRLSRAALLDPVVWWVRPALKPEEAEWI